MPKLRRKAQLRILDFDIENRPLSYLGSDFTTGEITAIAASWIDVPHVSVRALGEFTPIQILEWFRDLYDRADVVTGHYITRHDLPYVTDAMVELGLGPLSAKLASDTKTHLKRGKGLSYSQENLAAMLGVPAPKIQMNQYKWREANRLTPEGIALTKERVTGDVQQHKQMREALVARGLLRPPEVWRP